MLWGERVTRRRAIVGILVAFALADAALAFVFFGEDGAAAPAPAVALPLHPVAGNFVPDDTQLSQCTDEPCFWQAFGNIAYREGPKPALALVDDVYGSGGSQSCHRVVHAIGAASLARYGGSVARTFAEGDSLCGSGYYHGVLERSLVNVRSREPDVLAPVARTLCDDAAAMSPWIAYQCLHGLGHGLMIATGLNLPISLQVCSRLRRWWDGDACRSGVFMENLSSSYGVRSHWLRDEDPVYPCNSVQAVAKRRCYQMVTSRILPSVGDDWTRTAEMCTSVESAFVRMCFRSFGRDASSRSNRDPATTIETCAIARPYGGEDECISAAAQDVVSNFNSGERARALCDAVPSSLAEPCFEGLGSVMGRLRKTVEARAADCRALTSSDLLVEACMHGGRGALPRT
jgi:hypothetical protein